MSDFIVSARKYRPATFDTVVGQQHITNTLKNAILNKQLAHAFLFCGPRGVGKTTCARILAKTMNCFHLQPNGEACDNCDSCESFKNGQSFNIIELDAASNNSVESMRELIENVRFAPHLGKYKIYIIDEVHMLSNAAFNAFLKTLEEPPAHAIFILATTEKHKILPTILSRCQIFDFHRIQVEDIANHLAFIAEKENVSAEPDALHIIAQKADGGLRDACSMFDQIVTFGGNNITYENVIENLNILDYDYYFSITDAMLNNDFAKSLIIFNQILGKGFDGHLFISGLASHFRNLLVSKDVETLQLLEVANSIKTKYKEQCQKCTILFLIQAINICSKTDFQYKLSKNQRLLVELSLMQIANTEANAAEKKNDINESSLNLPPQKKEIYNSPKSNIEPVLEDQHIPIVKTLSSEAKLSSDKVKPKITSTGINHFTANQNKGTDTKIVDSISTQGSNESFEEKTMQQVWNNFANRFDKYSALYVTLTTRTPSCIETKIFFTIDNAAQQIQLSEVMQDLLSFLRKELLNSFLTIELIINKDETKKVPYTNKEKFEAMSKKNPALIYLKEKFEGEV